ncbi:hypothetical protein [Ligilactobacillus sp. UO.C109]|uniref:hypothetical protein n=1 Tax=Ligilactobacillus sp. UO.C109 TaxID=3003264 RepID=UPI002286C142|nr:hypothetical protein [Ligilactobacillus sp. UO.C109]MCZ0745058.1 hypothetical protein [Ligilactobacillus sp. UO.C109]
MWMMIRDNNPGLPEGTKIDVGDNGDTTITYPDKSVDTITGDKLVEEKTSAENLDPTVKAKTKVDEIWIQRLKPRPRLMIQRS